MPRHRHRRKPKRKHYDLAPRKPALKQRIIEAEDCGATCGRCGVCIAAGVRPIVDWD